jgi:hypothetical protein
MIKTVIAFVTRRPTMAVALASLEKTLTNLDAVVVHQNAKASKHAVRVAKHSKAEDEAIKAADHAKRVGDRLATLLA